MRDVIDAFREADTVPFGVNFADAESHLVRRYVPAPVFDLLVKQDDAGGKPRDMNIMQ